MLGNTYYHGTIKKAIIAFGNIFNGMTIERADASGAIAQRVKVPISYAKKQKFLAREAQQPDIGVHAVQIVIPRMSFEIVALERDTSRQMNANHKIKTTVGGSVNRQYNGVTWNLGINLYALTKTQEDGLQIVEQILPMFNPTYTVTMKSLPEMGFTDDLPITLEQVIYEDNFDAGFNERQEVVWTFSFALPLTLYGPTEIGGKGLIKRTEVGIFNQPDMNFGSMAGTIANEVSPFTSGPNDPYTILTEITGFE